MSFYLAGFLCPLITTLLLVLALWSADWFVARRFAGLHIVRLLFDRPLQLRHIKKTAIAWLMVLLLWFGSDVLVHSLLCNFVISQVPLQR